MTQETSIWWIDIQPSIVVASEYIVKIWLVMGFMRFRMAMGGSHKMQGLMMVKNGYINGFHSHGISPIAGEFTRENPDRKRMMTGGSRKTMTNP